MLCRNTKILLAKNGKSFSPNFPKRKLRAIDCKLLFFRERIGEARDELMRMLAEDELREAVLLIFANKQDLPNAMNAAEITDKLGLQSLRNRTWYIQVRHSLFYWLILTCLNACCLQGLHIYFIPSHMISSLFPPMFSLFRCFLLCSFYLFSYRPFEKTAMLDAGS